MVLRGCLSHTGFFFRMYFTLVTLWNFMLTIWGLTCFSSVFKKWFSQNLGFKNPIFFLKGCRTHVPWIKIPAFPRCKLVSRRWYGMQRLGKVALLSQKSYFVYYLKIQDNQSSIYYVFLILNLISNSYWKEIITNRQ